MFQLRRHVDAMVDDLNDTRHFALFDCQPEALGTAYWSMNDPRLADLKTLEEIAKLEESTHPHRLWMRKLIDHLIQHPRLKIVAQRTALQHDTEVMSIDLQEAPKGQFVNEVLTIDEDDRSNDSIADEYDKPWCCKPAHDLKLT